MGDYQTTARNPSINFNIIQSIEGQKVKRQASILEFDTVEPIQSSNFKVSPLLVTAIAYSINTLMIQTINDIIGY